MARYIDIEKAEYPYMSMSMFGINSKDCKIYNEGVKATEDMIQALPTPDVEEVRHGEWLPVTYTYFGLKRYECSECKDDEYWQKRYLEHKEKFCPNCGAKMDGGKAE